MQNIDFFINILRIIFIILWIGHLLTCLVFSFLFIEYDFNSYPIAQEIKNSIDGKPIISLNLKSACSPDEEILIFGEWDGTKEVCMCDDTIRSYTMCIKSYGQGNPGCRTIESVPPIKYQKINSKYICIKRYNKTYRELLKSRQIISKNKECPLNYKSCGIIDTLERQLCFKNEEDCPITAEYFRNTNSNLIIKDKPFNTLNNNQILSLIKIHEYIPCMHPSEKNWHYNSILQDSRTCNTKILDKLLDNRYEEIPTMVTIKYYLYKDNEIDDKYNDYNLERVIVNLYGRSFMGFEGKKIDNYSYEDLLSYQTISNRCKTGMKYLFFITLGEIFIFAFYLIVNRGLGEYFHLFILYYIIVYLIYGIFDIIIFCYSLKIEKIFDIKESDKYSNEIIQLLIDTFSKNYYYSLSLIIVFGYMVLLTPISLVIFVPILRVRNKVTLL
jgi:hypothetical protein